jgi:hypothetical protein
MTRVKQRIVCDYGVGKVLAGEYGITVQAVSWALNFKSNSLQAKEIRKRAMKKYQGTLLTTKKIKSSGKSKKQNN